MGGSRPLANGQPPGPQTACRHRRKRTQIAVTVWLAVILAFPLSLHAGSVGHPAGFGTWVWSKPFFATEKGRQRLVRFCVKNGISHLDVQFTFHGVNPNRRLQDEEALRDLVALTGRHNITMAALLGNPRMFFSQNHEQSLRELSAIIAFGKSLPEKSLFKGIKYDVEPYLTQEWKAKGEALNTIMRDYLAYLRKAKTALREQAPALWLAVDTPFWWDKEDFALTFEGNTKRFSEHIQDLTDFIVVMSYRRSAAKVLGVTADEMGYAKRIGKVILLSLETNELKHDQDISYWDLPKEKLLDTISQLFKSSREYPVIGGLMVHSYRGLLEKLDDGGQPDNSEPQPGADRLPE